jgi:ribonucleoside-triphosphate reductase
MTDKDKVARDILSDITVHMKYARYLPEKERRETWAEIVDRNKSMHIKKYPELEGEINSAYQMVYEKKVLPSMRSMQFGGKPIEVAPNRIYNCAFAPSMTGGCLARLCFCFWEEQGSDTAYRNTM